MKEVWLIRHAESAGNAGQKTTSTDTNPLTEKGHEQAEKLAGYLKSEVLSWSSPDIIIVSPFVRTKQTAEPYIRRLVQPIVIERPVQEFTYLSADKYANTSVEERIPARNAYWERADPDYQDGGGAESFNDMILRARETINDIMLSSAEKIVVFSHGWFIKTIWWLILNEQLNEEVENPMQKIYGFYESVAFPNVAILKLSIDADDRISFNLDRPKDV